MFESHRKSTEIWKSREKGVKTQCEPQISIRTIIVNHWQIIENNKNSLNIIWKNMKITKARQQPHISTFSGTHWPSPREATSQRGESSYLFKSEPKQHECARCIEHLCDLFANGTPWKLRGLEPNQSWWSFGEHLSFREIQLFEFCSSHFSTNLGAIGARSAPNRSQSSSYNENTTLKYNMLPRNSV